MKLFTAWLFANKNGFLGFFCCVLSFLSIFFLYRLPLGAVIYAALITIFFLIIISIADYLKFLRKHKHLRAMSDNLLLLEKQLYDSSNLIEQDYHRIIHALTNANRTLFSTENSRYKELTEYYTIWAHQIKTPIAAMGLILQDEDSLSRQELKDELLRIEQYVEMVLCYLRLDSESTDYKFQEYPLDHIIRQAIRHYASQFIRKKILLEYESLNYLVLTDEKWLLFVIEQLLSNALKYTHSGTISITMDAPGILCIRDTGIGIASEDLPRIFEKGFTGYNGRTDKKSSGIGLYLCRRICHSLGHDIRIESKAGAGTCVCLNLKKAALEIE